MNDSIDDDVSTTEIMIWLIGLNDIYMYWIDSLHKLIHYLKVPICLDLKDWLKPIIWWNFNGKWFWLNMIKPKSIEAEFFTDRWLWWGLFRWMCYGWGLFWKIYWWTRPLPLNIWFMCRSHRFWSKFISKYASLGIHATCLLDFALHHIAHHISSLQVCIDG